MPADSFVKLQTNVIFGLKYNPGSMDILNYFSLLIAPAIALLIILYLKFKVRGISSSLLVSAFLWGMLSILPVLLMQLLADYLELANLRSLRRIIFYSLVIIALSSELSKFLVLKLIYYPKTSFRTPVDGILYSVIIAMGFATVSNILFFAGISDVTVNSINAVTSGPANVAFGVLMGFFLGLGRLRKLRFIDSMTGLMAAVFFHALYYFCLLTNDYKLLTAFFIGSAVVVFTLSIASVRISMDAGIDEKRP